MAIVRGTTPTITYSFSKVSAADITAIYLTVALATDTCTRTLFEKDLDDATVDSEANTIAWELTQAETLLLPEKAQIQIQIRYTIGTKAYASKIWQGNPDRILKSGVI